MSILGEALTILRRPLATSQYLDEHSRRSAPGVEPLKENESSLKDCAHYFLDPLSWMRDELEQGKLDGRLECPKCHTNIGKYAWQGMQCSCGSWIVPGISLSKSRIDQVRSRTAGNELGIRLPPGSKDMRTQNTTTNRPPMKENL